MTTHDATNAVFEGGGAIFLCLNVRRLLHVAAGAELDCLGEALNAPRRVETDAEYRQRLHDLACGMAGCP